MGPLRSPNMINKNPLNNVHNANNVRNSDKSPLKNIQQNIQKPIMGLNNNNRINPNPLVRPPSGNAQRPYSERSNKKPEIKNIANPINPLANRNKVVIEKV